MKRLWLLFAQTVTVLVAVWFVLITLKPEWVQRPSWNTDLQVFEVAPGAISPTVSAGSLSFAAKKASPAVVSINTSQKAGLEKNKDPWFRYFFGDQDDSAHTGLGSGVIVSPQGYILTNNHVVEAADEILVMLNDGRQTQAKVIGTDPETDLAVLKVNLDKLPVMVMNNSEQVQVGDIVLAIGNPFGVGQTVTSGIISALGRNQLGINTFENFIQTDAAINPGNSGGALVDVQGNLLGINTAIYSKSGGSMGIGFAIPVSIAKQVMEQIIRQGSVTRGWIGIEAQDMTLELAESFKLKNAQGSLIAGIIKNSPAERAGLKAGDVLLEINGLQVIDSSNMLGLISELKPNKQAILKITRNQKEINVPVMIGRRPKLEAN